MTASKKQSIRPTIPHLPSQENAREEERFQNEVLRPILKMQHDLILSTFQFYLTRTKKSFEGLEGHQKKTLVAQSLTKDATLKLELRGMILGQLTPQEYETYIQHASTLNKRINNMLQERIISTL